MKRSPCTCTTPSALLVGLSLAALVACSDPPITADDGLPDATSRSDTGTSSDAGQLADSGVDAGTLPDAAARLVIHSGSPGGAGNLDGARREARFSGPGGIARAADGTIYVADTSNLTIRRIAPDGIVTTLAGSSGRAGSADGVGAAARFELPTGLAIAPSGDLIVSDSYAGTLRRVTPAGEVSTYAGRHGQLGNVDGTLSAARFRAPEGLAFDGEGNLFVADRDAHTIRRITPAGMVSTWIGSDGTPGSTDGARATALLSSPFGVAVGPLGVLAIADAGNNVIRIVDSAGVVSTLAGTAGEGQDTVDGTGAAARFGRPRALVFLASGDLVIADTFNDRLRLLSPAGVVTTWAGSTAGAEDGALLEAKLSFPSAIWRAEEAGVEALYVVDTGSSIIRRIAQNQVTTFAGAAAEVAAVDGPIQTARYFGPMGLLERPGGQLIVADAYNNALRLITTASVTTLGGDPADGSHLDGPLSVARFQSPRAFLEDGQGGYFLADAGNNRIRRISAQGEVSTYAGGQNGRGQSFVDGPLLDARFAAPGPMVRDSQGVIYLSDSGNHAIRRLRNSGEVDTLAGDGLPDYLDGAGDVARFNGPDGLLLIDDHTLIVADALNHVLRKIVIAADGRATVSLFAGVKPVGGEPRPGNVDGVGAGASFNTPRGLLRDGESILVADSNNSLIRRVRLSDAAVSTVAGTRGQFGIRAGALPGVLFEPQTLLRRSSGEILVTSFAAMLSIEGL